MGRFRRTGERTLVEQAATADRRAPAGAAAPPAGTRGGRAWAVARRASRTVGPALLVYAAVRVAALAALAVWADRRGVDLGAVLGERFDAAWFAGIAADGYDHGVPAEAGGPRLSNLAFFPLYPGLVRLAALLPGVGTGAAGVLVAGLCALAAAAGIFLVGRELRGRRVGLLLVALWAALPHAVVQQMAYSESLFTALAAFTLYALLRGRWLTAAALCVAAGLTRSTAVALIAAVGVAAALAVWQHLRTPPSGVPHPGGASPAGGAPPAGGDPSAGGVSRAGGAARGWGDVLRAVRRGAVPWRPVLAVLVAPLGWLGYLAWVGARLGRWDGWFAVQERWGSRLDGGWYTARYAARALTAPSVAVTVAVVTAVLAVALVCAAVLRAPAPVLTYALVSLALVLATAGYYPVKARLLLPAFPLLLPLAAVLARAGTRARAVALAAAVAGTAWFGGYVTLVWTFSP
ncbi:membrane protein [Pilimelia terevasa]|uniref:Membrane protein n=1 Tax=Pilimelia terevasa TaxID=53372 RepID=A0A8J3BLG7_9ACTN|nr:glycosyltransferase family 39 protein [Pilimelia terevasa]GGK12377.1 membrane protein [Pilimelia terevasa]